VSDGVLARIKRRVWAEGTVLRFVTAVTPSLPAGSETWDPSGVAFEDLQAAALAHGDRVLQHCREEVGELPGVDVQFEVLRGSPAESIIEDAERWGADLIIVGSHGYGAVRRFLLGSVSHAVALHAPCSVEIVRQTG
jgi:nucleotide-binding universal stress UspA family protein